MTTAYGEIAAKVDRKPPETRHDDGFQGSSDFNDLAGGGVFESHPLRQSLYTHWLSRWVCVLPTILNTIKFLLVFCSGGLKVSKQAPAPFEFHHPPCDPTRGVPP
jgi:hypothetical protein